ncbi:ribosomal RNA-processing protein 8-like [Watersipora subatra]|uniref:ribosomal RNA-processing protein 8-like n=1 Tax=Watersipora subatra TaxID=2589382 RepID=UPI00355C4F2E
MSAFQKNKLLKLFGDDVSNYSECLKKVPTGTNKVKRFNSSNKHPVSAKLTASGKVNPPPATNLSRALSGPPVKKLKRKQASTTVSGTGETSKKHAKASKIDKTATKSNVSSTKAKKGHKVSQHKVKSSAAKERLEGARFRFINELLYTSSSKDAVASFKKDPSSFDVYHQGYRRQIANWPIKPIDLAISFVKSRPKGDVIADLGCGEAMLAAAVPHKVHSFDIRALNDRVTVADMAHLPLEAASVHVVIYCLSLMGTNMDDFLKEAHRVLKNGGILWLAEVESRFDRGLDTFCIGVESFGFKRTSSRNDLSHFVTVAFRKTSVAKGKGSKQKADISLAPCLYKKR